MEMACKAILAALDDAGLTIDDVDGFSIYSGSIDPALVAQVLGIPEIRCAATTHRRVAVARRAASAWPPAAIVTGMADVVVSLMTLQQAKWRFGGTPATAPTARRGAARCTAGRCRRRPTSWCRPAFSAPGHSFSLLAQRHMHLYGTKREHFAEVAISHARQRDPARDGDHDASRSRSTTTSTRG